ncbi:MAG: nucleotidyltransferase domain-containing protein [Desulfamplus sp.]
MSSFDAQLKNDILEKLSNALILKDVILFGSYAYGNPHKDSDIDIMVVLDQEGFADSYMEKINRRMKVIMDPIIRANALKRYLLIYLKLF